MLFGIIVFLSALSISAVAIYYSVAGLAAIFAAAVIPIIIMGVVLEVGKLVTAVWLHRYWYQAHRWLRGYLAVAVGILMFITSMGIFGFLSKAHIEQTAMSDEQSAQVEQLDDKLARSEAKILRWNEEINRMGSGIDYRVDRVLDKEQLALDKIFNRIETAKDKVREDITSAVEQQQSRIAQARDRKETDVKAAQQKFEDSFGGSDEYNEIVRKATELELSVASRAQREIRSLNAKQEAKFKEIDKLYAQDVKAQQNRINNLRSKANVKVDDIDSKTEELEAKIDAEQNEVDELREQKFVYEKEYRKLEAEVGPIKYIAEFIYGENADRNILEKAVRWVIIIIIFVFDPLAVLLLIASQYTFDYWRQSGGRFGWFGLPVAYAGIRNLMRKNKQLGDKEIVEVIKEVPVEVVKERIIEKPVEVEKIVQVEKIVTKEVPVDRIVEKEVIKEVPVEKIVEVEKPVEVEKIVEVEKPVEVIREVEVEKEVIKEIEVPVEVIKEVIKEVPVEIIKEVEKIVEVPVNTNDGETYGFKKEIQMDKVAESQEPVEALDAVQESGQDVEIRDGDGVHGTPGDQGQGSSTDGEKPSSSGGQGQQQEFTYVQNLRDLNPEQIHKMFIDGVLPREEMDMIEINQVNKDYVQTVAKTNQGASQPKDHSIDSLSELYNDLDLSPDALENRKSTTTGFGTKFPVLPNNGDTFLRVDYLPTRLYKHNGERKQWIQIDKASTDTYKYNKEYISYLADKVVAGEYDIELLSETEQQELEKYLVEQEKKDAKDE